MARLRHLAPFAVLALAACGDDSNDNADTGADAVADTAADADDASVDVADDVETGADAPDVGDDVADVGDDAEPDVADAGDDVDAAQDADTAVERTLDPWPTWTEPPACGTPADWPGILPGPGDEGFDADLADKAWDLERQFHAFNTFGVGVSRELGVSLANTDARDLIDAFITETDEWDFEEWAEQSPADVITSYSKVAGAYGGVGAAADAFRYAVLLREGASCEEIEIARGFVVESLDAMHLATAITGVPGVIARGFARSDQPGSFHDPIPLFDDEDNPLPEEKTNGTWRADNSGEYPDYYWEDSCSRDMLIGWAIGMAATWEVIRDDPTFDQALKDRLRADALAIARSLMTVQDSGYDLEIRDADGRMTYHGILHHSSIDRAYLPGIKNGFNALMGLGILSGLAFITEDPEVEAFIYNDLIDSRDYLDLIVNEMNLLDLGYGSNFSMYNMATQGGWMAQRYLRDPVARAAAGESVRTAIYDRGGNRQPREQKQTFFDFTYVASLTGNSAFTPATTALPEDALTAISNGLDTLGEWNSIPYWNYGQVPCDETEVESGDCVAEDGTEITVLGAIGRNDSVIAEEPVPMRLRPASNYWWRSNPYQVVGGGDGSGLYPGADFRFAYWMGRYFQSAE